VPSLSRAADRLVDAGEYTAVAMWRFKGTVAGVLAVAAVAATAWSWWSIWGPARFIDVSLPAGGDTYVVPALTDLTLASPPIEGDVVVDDAAQQTQVEAMLADASVEEVVVGPLDDTVTSYLIFSVGSGALTQEDADRYGVADIDRRGDDQLTDTLMLLLTQPSSRRAVLLSIPRDTWIQRRGSRINAVLARGGPQALVDEVSVLTGVPVNHLVQVDFAGFGAIIDAVGGVEVAIDRPLRDVNSGLLIPQPGCVQMGGRTALSYVRSRQTQTISSSGGWTTDVVHTDIGRIARQQQIMGLLWDQHGGPDIVTRIPQLLAAAGRHVVLDESLRLDDVVDLARSFSSVSSDRFEGLTLPATSGRVGEASVLFVDQAAAAPMLEGLRAWPDVVIDPVAAQQDDVAAQAAPVAPVSDGPPPRYVTGPVVSPTALCAPGAPRTVTP
jgi:LCP family protein required for cell wall assembly